MLWNQVLPFILESQIFDLFSSDESVNLALKKAAYQSSIDHKGYATNAVDGNRNMSYLAGRSCSHTDGDTDPWWYVDLFSIGAVSRVYVVNRNDKYFDYLSNFELRIGESYSVLSHFCDSVPLCDPVTPCNNLCHTL